MLPTQDSPITLLTAMNYREIQGVCSFYLRKRVLYLLPSVSQHIWMFGLCTHLLISKL